MRKELAQLNPGARRGLGAQMERRRHDPLPVLGPVDSSMPGTPGSPSHLPKWLFRVLRMQACGPRSRSITFQNMILILMWLPWIIEWQGLPQKIAFFITLTKCSRAVQTQPPSARTRHN